MSICNVCQQCAKLSQNLAKRDHLSVGYPAHRFYRLEHVPPNLHGIQEGQGTTHSRSGGGQGTDISCPWQEQLVGDQGVGQSVLHRFLEQCRSSPVSRLPFCQGASIVLRDRGCVGVVNQASGVSRGILCAGDWFSEGEHPSASEQAVEHSMGHRSRGAVRVTGKRTGAAGAYPSTEGRRSQVGGLTDKTTRKLRANTWIETPMWPDCVDFCRTVSLSPSLSVTGVIHLHCDFALDL